MYKLWCILFAVINLLALGLFLVAPFTPGWWLPVDVSTFGHEVDWLYYLILYTTGFFFVLTEVLLVYFMWKYAKDAQPAGTRSAYVHGNNKLEWFWTLGTVVILLVVAFSQVRAWERIKYQSQFPVPDHILEVSARQFEWRMRYPTDKRLKELVAAIKTSPKEVKEWDRQPSEEDVRVVNDLHTWKGAKVRVYLKTRDVLHSFFLPNLRLKQDAVPGKTIPVWFEVKNDDTTAHNIEWDEAAKKWNYLPNSQYPLACAELCGWGHYKMQGRLLIHKDKASYDRWLAEAEKEQNRRQVQ